MKKIFTPLLFLIPFLFYGKLNATNYYFSSSTGNDSYTNSQAQNPATPWRTLAKLNSFFSSLQAGDSVLFKRGDTFIGSIIPSKSGTTALPIIISAYGSGSNPVISGGTVLTSWTDVGGGIYETTLTSAPKMVTINGQQYAPGRYPDNTWLTIDATNGTNITSSGLSGQSNLVGASVVIRKNRSIIDKGRIDTHSGNTIGYNISYNSTNAGFGFFITDKLSTLNVYGEWFYDNAAQKLKVFFGSAGTSAVTASSIGVLIPINNNSNISFSNLDISHANSVHAEFQNIDRISFDNCNFRFSGGDMILCGGSNNTNLSITNCSITNINNDGLHLYGGNNNGLKIQNNIFTNIGSVLGEGGNGWGSYSGIIMEGNACINARIEYNKFENIGYSCIQGGATNSLVKNNLILNSCMYMDDGAAIYVQEANGTGKRVTGNIIIGVGIGVEAGTDRPDGSNNQGKGIYSDDRNAYTEIDNNTVINADDGIYLNDSHDINIHHNTLYGNGQGIAMNYLFGSGMWAITTNNNTVVQTDAGSYCFSPQNLLAGPSIATWGQMNNNWYARPLNQGKVVYSWAGTGNASNYTIPEWGGVYGHDQNSLGSPITVSDASKIRIEYNQTNTNKVVSLGGNYMAINGTVYNGSITLAPYTSVVLLQTSATVTNQLPTANAGLNQNITLPTNSLTLTGTGTDPDGSITAYQWTKIAGPASGTIVSPAQAATVINSMVQGVYQFELRVTDNQGAFGRDTVVVTVNAAVINQLPTANAGLNQNITLPTNSLTLTGTGTDPDGSITAYQWTKIAGPASGTIVSPAQAATVINSMVQGVYQFELRVTDNQGAFGRDTVVVTVNAAVINQLPTANAGLNQNITLPTNSLTLTGTGTDPDGSITAYQWTKIAGPASGTIVSPAQAATVINSMVQGVYQFELRVTDNQGAFGRDTVVVTVNAAVINQLPTANAGLNQNITLPTNSLTLTGTGTDPDGSITAYQWTKIAGPASGTIVSPAQAATVINSMVQGVYQFELRVTDNQGAFGRDTVVVTVNAAVINQLPTANAGLNQNITLPTNSLTLTGTGTDPDGSITAYQWTKIAGPASGTIVSPAQAATVINSMVQGVYQFELRVTDNQGAFGRDTVVVTVNAAVINQLPTANAGLNQNITLPTNSLTLTGTGTDPDGSITAYQWAKIAGPASGTIVSPAQAATVINSMVQGVYQFELRVTDNQGAFGRDTVVVTVNAAVPSNGKPTSKAGKKKVIVLPTASVLLEGSGTDPDGTITEYNWRVVASPASCLISNPQLATTEVTNLTEGIYKFELKVTDNNGAAATDTVEVEVKRLYTPVASIFPNPVTGVMNLKIESPISTGSATLTIYDMSGRLIYKESFIRNQGSMIKQIDATHFRSGTYIIKIDSGGYASSLKMTKQ